MPLVQVVILGVIQGLTEFLPVSSTAHLALAEWLFKWPVGLEFDIALHAGTLLAVLLYFFRDWLQVIGQGLGLSFGGDPELRRNRGLLWLLAVATIPAAAAGYLFKQQAETSWRSPYVIASTMIGLGLVMWWAEIAGRKQKDIGHISPADALVIGVAQALAVVPGVSRSGITITAGLFRNLERQAAARFSFMLSTPIILGAAAKDFRDLIKEHGHIPSEYFVGMAVSAVVGILVIRFFLAFLRRGSLAGFAAYRILFGIIVIALATFFRYHGG
jgi:undecaprenyl-diphosphatase